MKKFLCVLVVLSVLIPVKTAARELEYTLPNHLALRQPNEIGQLDPICAESTSPLANLYKVRAYRYLNFWGWSFYRDKDVYGREGQLDSLNNMPDGYNWYLTTINTIGGESCPSDIFYDNTTTGVELNPSTHAVSKKLFNVRGQLIPTLLTNGIYFERITWSDGKETTTKFLYLKNYGKKIILGHKR